MVAIEREHRRFTADEVHRMLESGILGEDEPLELIEGNLVVVNRRGPSHAHAVTVLAARLRLAWSGGVVVREEKPLEVGPHSLPEPDVAVARGQPAAFARRHPTADETVLAAEVAQTSQDADRRRVSIYARAGIPEVWWIDLATRHLEVHTDPQPDGRYRTVQVLAESDAVAPRGSAGGSLGVAEVLP